MYRPKVPEHITSFQLAVLVLSVFVVSLAIELVFNLPSDVLQILIYVDTFFIIDFVQQYRAAPSKLEYMKWGWLDLIFCIPLME
ncbi:Putative membrane protein [Vibrio parahaemolyticus]